MARKLILLIMILVPLQTMAGAETLMPKIDFSDASLFDIVQILCNEAGLDFVAPSDLSSQKRVSLHLRNISAEDAIDYILRTNGLSYEKKGNSILISTLPQDLTQSGYKKLSKTVELKYLSGEKVSQMLAKIMPELISVPGERANCLIMRGKDSDLNEADALIVKIDKPIPQILIEGKIVEISKSESIRFGLDHNGGIFKFINGKREDIKSALNAMLADGRANIIAAPRIATLDNHEAVINIGNRIPYAVPVSSSSSSTSWTVEYIDAGIKLKITPRIGLDNQIITTLAPEVSQISEWRTTNAGEFPVISTRNAQATLRTKSGETIVVGGLDSEDYRENVSRIPIIGQFPILNLFFQNRTFEKTKTEIVFLITPYVI